MDDIKRIDRTLVRNCKIFDYYQDTMAIPNGNVVKFDHIDHKGAAAVIPVLDDGRIILVRQFRNSIDRHTWEIPAGGLNSRQEPTIEAARRELEEETGYTTEKELEWLITIHTTPAFCNEKIDIYVATDLKPGKQHLDEDEVVTYQAFTVKEIQKMILEGKMTDAKTIAAVMSYAAKQNIV